MKKCYELIEGKHRKFWTVEVVGGNYIATFGRIGTPGTTQVKTFSERRHAMEKAEAMIDAKLAKGYRYVGDRHPGAKASLLDLLKSSPMYYLSELVQDCL